MATIIRPFPRWTFHVLVKWIKIQLGLNSDVNGKHITRFQFLSLISIHMHIRKEKTFVCKAELILKENKLIQV